MLRSSQAPVLLLLHPQLSFGAKHPPANESGGGGGEGANGAATSWILDTAHPGVGTLVCTGLDHWAGDTGLSLLMFTAACRMQVLLTSPEPKSQHTIQRCGIIQSHHGEHKYVVETVL